MATKNKNKNANANANTTTDGTPQVEGEAATGQVPSDALTPSQDTATPTPEETPQAQDAASPPPLRIHKGVYLSALIYVEGSEDPSADFNSLTISALKANLNQFFAEAHDGLMMTLKNVNVENNIEEASKAKFQF
jgi:hypothetical protein